MNKLSFFIISFMFLNNNLFAEETNMMALQNTECDDYSITNSEYELTYEEKMQIASEIFESEINKNENACDSNFTSEKKNTSANSSSGSSAVAGGIKGEQTLDDLKDSEAENTNFGSNASMEEEGEGQKMAQKGSDTVYGGQDILENGKIPECISRIGGDDEIAMQIKESISMVSDEDQKKELIKAYSDYKGLNIDPDQC